MNRRSAFNTTSSAAISHTRRRRRWQSASYAGQSIGRSALGRDNCAKIGPKKDKSIRKRCRIRGKTVRNNAKIA